MQKEVCRCFVKELNSLYKICPSVAVKIETSLGLLHCHKYLKNLILQDRKAEFSNEVYCQILKLYQLHVEEFGDFSSPIQIINNNITDYTVESVIL